ncbi:hypothetical protein GCM10023092_19410 [Rurimicrobium arvi]|uniref:DUF4421 domain-containing protein n=1 Tax=Rurimicrobium arvi TaxID=2049916 RepID=A0ABP8MVM7_9BACT
MLNRKQLPFHKRIFTLICLATSCSALYAQEKKTDTATVLRLPVPEPPNRKYIGDYHRDLTLRVFGARRYYSYGLHDKGFAYNPKYFPNTPFNIGAGFNYRVLGLNIGFNLPLINDTKEHGKTRFLDLQTHFYGRKLTMDVLFQHYRGFYMPEYNFLKDGTAQDPVYIRPDIRFTNLGFSAQYLLNGKKFSIRAAFLQNETQLRSAGSPIIGGGVNLTRIAADSSIIPGNPSQDNYFDNLHFNRSSILSSQVHAGYGYTIVLPLHLFITAAVTAGIGVNFSSLNGPGERTQGIGTDAFSTARLGMGYNSRRYFAGIQYYGTLLSSSAPLIYTRQEFGAGNFRISFARRFTLKKNLIGIY